MIFGKEGIYTMREQIQKEKWSPMNSVDVYETVNENREVFCFFDGFYTEKLLSLSVMSVSRWFCIVVNR